MTFLFFKHYVLSRQAGSLIRTIAWTSFLGVFISVMAMVVVLSIMTGFAEAIRYRIISVEPHIVISPNEKSVEHLEQRIKELDKNVSVFEYEVQDVIVRTLDGLYKGAVAMGMKKEAFREMMSGISSLEVQQHEASSESLSMLFGKVIRSDSEFLDLNPKDVVMGSDLAYNLMVVPGDEMTIIPPETLLLPLGEVPLYEKVRVKNVIRTNVPSVDKYRLYYALGKTLTRFKDSMSLQKKIEVRMGNPEFPEGIARSLKQEGYSVETWKERNSSLLYSLKMEKILMTLFLMSTLLIGCFSIVTVLALLGAQKRKDLGLLMALGLKRSHVKRLFTQLGLLLTGFGIFFGLFGGLAVCWWLETFKIFKLPDIYQDTSLPVQIDYISVSVLLFVTMVVSYIASWIPAQFNSQLTPIEALRSLSK